MVWSVIRLWSTDEYLATHLNPHPGQVRDIDPLKGPRVASFQTMIVFRDPVLDRDTAFSSLPEDDRLGLKVLQRHPLCGDVRPLFDKDMGTGVAATATSQVGGAKIGGGHGSLLGLSRVSSIEAFITHPRLGVQKNAQKTVVFSVGS